MADLYRYINTSNTRTITTTNYTIGPTEQVLSATTIPELDRLDGTLLDKYLNGAAREDPSQFNYYQPVLSPSKGDGIKLNIENPQYAWEDYLSSTTPYSGPEAHAPSFEEFLPGINKYRFKAGDRSYHEYHILHDYAPSTDMYIHVHWAHNSASVTGGSTTWEFTVTYAKGYSQQVFHTPKILTVTQDVVNTPLTHQIAETKLSVVGGSATQLNSSDIETDGIILVQTKLLNNTTGTNPFMMFCDIHYQSTGLGTKNKNFNFWT